MTACLSIVPLSMSMSMTEYTLSDPYLGKTDDVFVGHVDVGVFSWLNIASICTKIRNLLVRKLLPFSETF